MSAISPTLVSGPDQARIIIFGSTGTAGSASVQTCLADPCGEKVRAEDLVGGMLRSGLDGSLAGDRTVLENRDVRTVADRLTNH